MRRRQTIPRQWLIVADADAVDGAARAPRGSGVLVLVDLRAQEMRRLRNVVGRRDLVVVTETRQAAVRVHNVRELRRALLRRTPVILLSPLYPTSSHPEWKPLPRMRAAALARLAARRLVALGGMNAKRYAALAPLGFIGWAGISAFRT